MLYRWPGREPGAPTVLMAHYDVVPATDEGWQHPPFAADLTGEADGPGDLGARHARRQGRAGRDPRAVDAPRQRRVTCRCTTST